MSINKGNKRKQLGDFGEQFATDYVSSCLGWQICARNWRCRIGELDVVAKDHDTLVIIEVRTRHHHGGFGTALDSINFQKLRQIERVGHVYWASNPSQCDSQNLRFDAIVLQVKTGIVQEFQHFRGIL